MSTFTAADVQQAQQYVTANAEAYELALAEVKAKARVWLERFRRAHLLLNVYDPTKPETAPYFIGRQRGMVDEMMEPLALLATYENAQALLHRAQSEDPKQQPKPPLTV